MNGKIYAFLLTAVSFALGASATSRNVEIRQPASIGANDAVVYHDLSLDPVPASVDLSHLISVGQNSTTGELKRLATDPSAFTMALDTLKKEVWIIKCNSTDASVTIPDEITVGDATYPVAVINTNAFSALPMMKDITFGKNIRTIMPKAFLVCMNLTTVNLNEGLVEIQEQAFSTFTNKITSIELPSTVEILGERCFSGTSLSGEFLINKALRQIGGGAFAGKKITGFYIGEEGNNYFQSVDGALFTKDGETLVVYPPALVEPTLVVPSSVKKLAPYAFAYCNTVTKVVLPENLTEIGDFAFSGCKLTEFTVGKNVTKFGEGVLKDNTGLASIVLEEGNTHFTLTDGMLIDNATKHLLAVTYTKTEIQVPDGVTKISGYLCYNNQKVTSVSTPASVKEIGDNAFYGCQGIASIEMKGVERIGINSFYGVKKTQKVEFPSTLKMIDNLAFATGEIGEFVLPEGVDSIGYGAFMNSKIEKINIPGSAKALGSALFYQCPSLSTLTMGEGITYIPATMCYGCEKLYFFDFPSTIKEVKASAFSFSWLQIADLPEGCVKVEASAFQLAPLHYINMPNSLEEVGDFGFSITNAEYVKCGSGLKRLGQNALQSQKKAETITLNEGLEYIGFRALYGESNITEMTIPSTVTHIGDSAFILTPLTRLVNLSKTPQPLTSAITGNPYDPFPVVKPIYDTCTLAVPYGCAEAYRAADIWKLYEKIEELPTTEIKEIEDAEEIRIVRIYGSDGYLRKELGDGLNICVMSNGSVVKTMK